MIPLGCGEARPLLAAYVDGEVGALEAAALEQHAANCASCSAALQRERATRELIRSRAPYHRAPPALFERIAEQTSRQGAATVAPTEKPKRQGRNWQRWALPLAASLAMASLIDVSLQYRAAGDRLEGQIVDAHVRSLMVDHLADVPSTDQHTVKPWFADKLDFSPPVRDLASEGFPLVGGRLDYIDHHSTAALIYRHRLHVINLFVWPAHDAPPAIPSQQSLDGFNLVHWRGTGMEFWAVSDLNSEELEEFSQLLQKESH
jgi:anti-sigma factor (TIGR02949 family)